MSDFAEFVIPKTDYLPPFMSALESVRAEHGTDEWRALLKSNPIVRSWKFFLSVDPYTRWGLLKPRGYPGDATLMDFAYGHPAIRLHVADSGVLGQSIYALTSGAQQSQSARDRVELIRQEIVTLASRQPIAAVSVASGHARELEALPDEIRRRVLSFTAIDVDPLSLSIAQQSARRSVCLSQDRLLAGAVQ